MQKTTTFFMFVGEQFGKAEEAIHFYVSLFQNSRIITIARYGACAQGTEGAISHAVFTLNGQEYMAMESNLQHHFTFTPAVSIFVNCESEEEIDTLYQKVSDGGSILMELNTYPFSAKYAWVTDKYGLSLQLNLVRK